MKPKYLLLVFLLSFTIHARGAVWAPPSLYGFVNYAADVVEAELIYFEKDSAIYSTTSLYHPGVKKVVTFTGFSRYISIVPKFETPQDSLFLHLYYRQNLGINIEDASKLIVFLPPEGGTPSLTAAFYQYQNDIYLPVHISDDALSILPVDTTMTWAQLKTNILNAHARIESFKKLLAEKVPSQKNNAFWFKWIKEQEPNLADGRCPVTIDCGLGSQVWMAYNQIIESGDYKDAWKAESMNIKHGGSHIQDQSWSYTSEKARQFFKHVAFSRDITTEERLAALNYFEQSMWYPQVLNDLEVVPDKIRAEILATIGQLKSLFGDENYQYFIVCAFRSILESQNDQLKALAEEQTIPFLIQEYQRHRDNYLQFELQEQLFSKLSTAQLIQISDNPHGLLVDIGNLYIDTFMQRVSLQISVKVRDETVQEEAQIFFEFKGDHTLYNSEPFKLFSDYRPGIKGGNFMQSYKEMKPGTWSVHVEGLVGIDNPTLWKSNYIEFKVE